MNLDEMNKAIPCPVCNTPIPVNLNALLQGVSFVCVRCTAAISLNPESTEQLSEAVKSFQALASKLP